MEQIGTVETLALRIYPLDAAATGCNNQTEVVVQPGVHPLYSDGLSIFWMMFGRINTGRMHRLGDGIYTITAGDMAEGPGVTFPSRIYGPNEWADFVASDVVCSEGHPDQRLRVTHYEIASR